MRITRRELASALATGAALAQSPPKPPATPEEALQAARVQVKAVIDRLVREQVPMATEPAFQFRA